MATPRKRRPTFDTPKPTTATKSTWAYRTDAKPLAVSGAALPAATAVSRQTTPSVLNRMVTTPVMLGVLIVLAPLSWLSGSSRSR